MSYAGLAQRMTEVGCAIDASALYKIEKGSPRRRIAVDELVALADVFAVPLGELLAPPELLAKRRAMQALETYRQARAAYHAALGELVEAADADPLVTEVLNDILQPDDIPLPEVFYGIHKARKAHRGEHQETS
jgi:transcriptional regulator with XRE-family HTH domain